MKKVYTVQGIEKTHMVQIGNMQRELGLTWADGMVGVLPVFSNKKKAKKYAGKKT